MPMKRVRHPLLWLLSAPLLIIMLNLLVADSVVASEHQVDSRSLLQVPLMNAHGQSSTLEEFKGRVLYVDFWASWCIPCRKSFPWMNEIHSKYADKGLTVVAVNLDVDRAQADAFLAKTPANFALRFDPEGLAARRFDLLGMPSSYVFDREGRLAYVHLGFFTENSAKYEQELLQLLGDQQAESQDKSQNKSQEDRP
jgi:thiol-disulfide isomerase/thioredoxin